MDWTSNRSARAASFGQSGAGMGAARRPDLTLAPAGARGRRVWRTRGRDASESMAFMEPCAQSLALENWPGWLCLATARRTGTAAIEEAVPVEGPPWALRQVRRVSRRNRVIAAAANAAVQRITLRSHVQSKAPPTSGKRAIAATP